MLHALNRTVKEFGLREPGKILDKTRELLLETFSRSQSDVKDGMDISLLSIRSEGEKKIISWSGANNPLWYTNEGMMKEITANKQPIGKSDHATPFTTHLVDVKGGNMIYLFTDGYADQFGGPKGKKFKYKQLEELLLSIQLLPLPEQRKILTERFAAWRGENEQVDDVCIIGIRV